MKHNFKVENYKFSLVNGKENLYNLFGTTPNSFVCKLSYVTNLENLINNFKKNFDVTITENLKTKSDSILFIRNGNYKTIIDNLSKYKIENILLFKVNNKFDFNNYLYNNDFLEDENIITFNISNSVLNINNKEKVSFFLKTNKQ